MFLVKSEHKVNKIKLKGKVYLATTPGRKDVWVNCKVEHDYFLSLHITHINDQKIHGTKEAFAALRNLLPAIECNGQKLENLFEPVLLPPNADDILHITLGNFGDFRIDRSTDKEIDQDKVEKAKKLIDELDGKEIKFSVTPNDFNLVLTSEHKDNLKLSSGSVDHAKSVGYKRDAILNLKPFNQEVLADLSKSVFGDDFELWNSAKQKVPYHITIAQSDKMSETLNRLCSPSENLTEKDDLVGSGIKMK